MSEWFYWHPISRSGHRVVHFGDQRGIATLVAASMMLLCPSVMVVCPGILPSLKALPSRSRLLAARRTRPTPGLLILGADDRHTFPHGVRSESGQATPEPAEDALNGLRRRRGTFLPVLGALGWGVLRVYNGAIVAQRWANGTRRAGWHCQKRKAPPTRSGITYTPLLSEARRTIARISCLSFWVSIGHAITTICKDVLSASFAWLPSKTKLDLTLSWSGDP